MKLVDWLPYPLCEIPPVAHCPVITSSSIAETQTTIFGTKLREQVEERLTFFETGATPRKNVDVMKTAMDELTEGKMEVSTATELE